MSQQVAEEKASLERLKLFGNIVKQGVTELGDLAENVLAVFEEGVKSPNPAMSLISLVGVIDLLSGGAYTVPASQLPY